MVAQTTTWLPELVSHVAMATAVWRYKQQGFLTKEFGLVHHTTDGLRKPTTLGCTCIDHVFLRNMNTECVPYVSYFSYHRPLLN
jgi:hypothetical protein